MRFIHIADIHLGMTPESDKPWGKYREKEIFDSFYKILDECEKQKIDLLLIAGDLFHRQPLIRELKEINYAFGCLSHTKVVIEAGNHDYLISQSNYLNFIWKDNVTFFFKEEIQKVYFEELNTEVYGFSYCRRELNERVIDDVIPEENGRLHILLAHGGDEKYVPMDKRKLKETRFDYVALGHIHKPEKIGSRVAYCGCLEPLNRTEIGKRGYIIGELYFKEELAGIRRPFLEFEFIAFSKREYKNLEITINTETTNKELQDILVKAINDEGIENMYNITVTGLRAEEFKVDVNKLYTFGNVVEVDDNSLPDYDFEAIFYENRDNLIGKFIERIKKCDVEEKVADKALYYGIEALLHAKE